MESIQISSSEDDLKTSFINDKNDVNTVSIPPDQENTEIPSHNDCPKPENPLVVLEPNGNVLPLKSTVYEITKDETMNGTQVKRNTEPIQTEMEFIKGNEDSDSSTSDCFVEALSPGDLPEMRNKANDDCAIPVEESELKRLSANLSDVGYSTDQSNTMDSNELNDDQVSACSGTLNLSRRNSDESFCSALSPSDSIYVKNYPLDKERTFSNESNNRSHFSEGENSSSSIFENTILEAPNPGTNGSSTLCSEEINISLNNDTDETCSFAGSVSQSDRDVTLEPCPSDKCLGSDECQMGFEPSSLESDAAFGSLDDDSLASTDIFSESSELNPVESSNVDSDTIATSPLDKVSNIVSLFNKNSKTSPETQPKKIRLRSSIPCFIKKFDLSGEAVNPTDVDEVGNTDSLLRYKKQKVFSNRKALFEQLEKGNASTKNRSKSNSNNYVRDVCQSYSPKQIRNSNIQRSIKDELREIEGKHEVDPTKSPIVKLRHRKRSQHDEKPSIRSNDIHTERYLPKSNASDTINSEESVTNTKLSKHSDAESAEEQFYRSSMEIKFQDLSFCKERLSQTDKNHQKIPKLNHDSKVPKYNVDKEILIHGKPNTLPAPASSNETDVFTSDCPLNELLHHLEKEQQDLENMSIKAELANKDKGKAKVKKPPKVKKLISRFERP